MAIVDWHLQGHILATCTCNFGCPCQFMSPPTKGHCRAAVAAHVVRGHFGATKLDDTRFAGVFAWPGAIHEGHGEALAIVDDRASAAQREALLTILSGQESEPGATVFNVFASTVEKMFEPMFRRIDFSFDLERRVARFAVPDLIEGGTEPIVNPITGAETRARIVLPNGFEFLSAEIASGHVRSKQSPIPVNWSGTHAHMFNLDMTGTGPVHH